MLSMLTTGTRTSGKFTAAGVVDTVIAAGVFDTAGRFTSV